MSAHVPVTILCGFLGAGKTTLLNHLLGQAEGRRWALVVNDVGAINLDARLVAQQAAAVADGGGASQSQVVEIGNGCVCCTLQDDLAETIAQLAAEGRYDHIIIETTGVAEPRGIAQLFVRKNPFGRTLGDFARLNALVTVIDAAHFQREARRSGVDRREMVASAPKEIFELLVEQVECADLLVLNKCDLVETEELAEIEGMLRGLNARAEIVRAEQGQVSRESVLDRARFDAKETLGAARWIRALNTAAISAPSMSVRTQEGESTVKPVTRGIVQRPRAATATPDYTAKYGLTTFLFQARRPFARAKLETLLARGLPGLLRAKGFLWLDERPDEMGFLSLAGTQVRFDWLSYWWAALVESRRARRAEVPPAIETLWQEPHGDRRQELVFIGVRLDETAARHELETCFAR